MEDDLTERQKREREYFDEYAAKMGVDSVSFEPVLGKEKRPWNSYWAVYHLISDFYRESGQKLLDFGCGWGIAAMRYAHVGYDVYGFDISEKNIDLCRTLAEKMGYGECTHFSIQTAEHLQYNNDFFDVVAGIDILHHVDIEPAISEVHRVLKPGGLAVFREWIEVPLFDVLRNSAPVKFFFPKDASFVDQRTRDERKLNRHDMSIITRYFPDLETLRFCIFSRLRKILPVRNPEKPSRLEKMDFRLIRYFPFLKRFGGEIVLVLRKQ